MTTAAETIALEMLTKYGIEETTSKTQRKNGTRMFKLPNGQEFGSYKSGIVRKILRTRSGKHHTCYQINKQYKSRYDSTWMRHNGELITNSHMSIVRTKIPQDFARLKYILDYVIKNYGITEIVPKFVVVNGVKYIRYE